MTRFSTHPLALWVLLSASGLVRVSGFLPQVTFRAADSNCNGRKRVYKGVSQLSSSYYVDQLKRNEVESSANNVKDLERVLEKSLEALDKQDSYWEKRLQALERTRGRDREYYGGGYGPWVNRYGGLYSYGGPRDRYYYGSNWRDRYYNPSARDRSWQDYNYYGRRRQDSNPNPGLGYGASLEDVRNRNGYGYGGYYGLNSHSSYRWYDSPSNFYDNRWYVRDRDWDYSYGRGSEWDYSYGRDYGRGRFANDYVGEDSYRYGSRHGMSSWDRYGDYGYGPEGEGGYLSRTFRNGNIVRKIWESHGRPTTVQGGALQTWSFSDPRTEQVHVLLKSEGRPVDASVEVWNGPDHIPQKMRVYVEDGGSSTFATFVRTPRHSPSTIAVRNIGPLAFPVDACVGPDWEAARDCLEAVSRSYCDRIQGGALRTYPFSANVGSVLVYIETDGRPLQTRIELLQGPDHNKQILELYNDDGLYRPFLALIQTPGAGNVVRVINTATMEFPMTVTVVGYESADPDSWGNAGGRMLGREWRS